MTKTKTTVDGNSLRVVISGSYRKHLDDLMNIKKALQEEGIQVLAPVGNTAKNPGEEFIILDEDPIHDPRILQDSIFAKMRTASFHVVANKDGYIGKAALLEIGYAISLGLDILTLEKVDDPNIKPYTRLLSDVFEKFKGKTA